MPLEIHMQKGSAPQNAGTVTIKLAGSLDTATAPELERQLVVRGVLPVELRGRMYPCPPELEHQLPPPPPDCAHVFIGGHVVLVNRVSFQIVDVFHF